MFTRAHVGTEDKHRSSGALETQAAMRYFSSPEQVTRRPWQVYREHVLDSISDQPISQRVPADLARRLHSETAFCMNGAQTRTRACLLSRARAPNDNAKVQRLAVMQAAGTYAAFRQLPARERRNEHDPSPIQTKVLQAARR